MIWKDVPGMTGIEASEGGDIRRFGKPLRQYRRVRDYLGVFFEGRLWLTHRLVAMAFHGMPPFERAEAMHLDNDPTNNAASNLRWGSHAENMAMSLGESHSHKGESNGNARINREIVEAIRRAYDARSGVRWGRRHLAEAFGLSEHHVYRIATRKEGGWADEV